MSVDLADVKQAMAEADCPATPAEVTPALDRMAAAITGDWRNAAGIVSLTGA